MVLEILKGIEVGSELIESIKSLKQRGYLLAIDDYTFEDKWIPLLPLVDIVKVDVPRIDPDALSTKMCFPGSNRIRWLAEKVETREQFEHLKALNFSSSGKLDGSIKPPSDQSKRNRMQVKTILNRVQKFKSFVYGAVRRVEDTSVPTLEVEIQPR